MGTANLATLSYNAQALVSSVNYLTSSGIGSSLASDAFSYDGDLRPAGSTATWQSGSGSTGTIYSQGIGYDPAGNVLTQTMTQAAVPGQTGSGGTETQNFCYDEQNRLVYGSNSTATPAAGNGTCGTAAYQQRLGGTYTSSYVYTHLGQLWQGPYNGKGAYQYLYCNTSQPHQLTAVYPTNTNCANTSGKTQSYGASYDSWGNMTTRTVTGATGTLTYDPQDLLVRWNGSVNNQAEWYMYDGSGSRVLRRSFDGTNITITVYAFGMEEHQYQYSGSGTTSTNSGNTYYYTLGGKLLGTLSGTGTLSTTFLLSDTLGSVVASISNTAGGAAVLGNQAYGPYGNQRYVAGSLGTSKGYTGQYNDSLTGLDYYNARYYDPVVGCFLSADVAQGNALGMDPYAYVGGNPETTTDPTGRMYAPSGGAGGGNPDGGGYDGGCPSHGYAPAGCGGSIGGGYAGDPHGGYLPPTPTQVVTIAHGFTQHKPPSFGQTGSSMTPLLYNYLFHYQTWMRTEGVLEQDGMSMYQALVHDAWQFKNEVDAVDWNLWNLNDDMHHLLQAILYAALRSVPLEMRAVGDEGGLDVGGSCGGGLSFVASTKVATAQGEQAIGNLKVGEKVWAYNSKTHKMELQPIVHVWINHDNDLVDLTLTIMTHSSHRTLKKSEVLHTNKRHPFLTVEQGFLPVSRLTLGMHVERANGGVGVVTGWSIVLGAKTMYNLEVAQDHTFTVGDGQWVVHNCGGRSQDITFDPKQVQRKYTNNHATAFGMPENYNSANAKRYVDTLRNFIDAPTTEAIQGTYRGGLATHYFDITTQLDVIVGPNNQFISAWKLDDLQVDNLLISGNVQ